MKKKITLKDHLLSIGIGLFVAVVWGYFRVYRKGDVDLYVGLIVVLPIVSWAWDIVGVWLERRGIVMPLPTRIGIKYCVMGVMFFSIYTVILTAFQMDSPGAGVGGGIMGIMVMTASREAFKRGQETAIKGL